MLEQQNPRELDMRCSALAPSLARVAWRSDAADIPVEARGHAGDGWSVSGTGCRTHGGACQPVIYDDIHAVVGDTLVFRFGHYHDVFLSTATEKNCDFSRGRTLAEGGGGGGDGFRYLLAEPGTFVFSCSRSGNRPGWPAIGSHCGAGQVVKVVVDASEASDAASQCSLDGTWSTSYQEVQVHGTEGSYLGVWGALSEIEWTSPTAAVGRFRNVEAGRSGFFSWTFTDRCDTFTGQWGWGTAGAPVSGQWSGHRISASAPMAEGAAGAPRLLPGFVGPFERMGISGFNDLGHSSAFSPGECADRCAAMAACNSFDWGARGHARGECWLSTADRATAGHAFEAWELYDYFEKAPAPADGARSEHPPPTTAAAASHHSGGGTTTLPLPPHLLAILAVCFSLLLIKLGFCVRARRPSTPTAVVVQAAPVPLRGDGRMLSAGGFPVVIAEEAKGGGDGLAGEGARFQDGPQASPGATP